MKCDCSTYNHFEIAWNLTTTLGTVIYKSHLIFIGRSKFRAYNNNNNKSSATA